MTITQVEPGHQTFVVPYSIGNHSNHSIQSRDTFRPIECELKIFDWLKYMTLHILKHFSSTSRRKSRTSKKNNNTLHDQIWEGKSSRDTSITDKVQQKSSLLLRVHVQCFRQTVPLQESHVGIRDGPQKNKKRANLALSFYKAAGLTQTQYFKSHPRARNCDHISRQCN